MNPRRSAAPTPVTPIVGDDMKKLVICLGIPIAVLIVLFMIPFGPKTVLFRSVTEQDRMQNDVVFTSQLEGYPRGQYVIHKDKLYLNTQETRGALVLTTFVSFTEWTPEMIEEFRRTHPELEKYWPDPGSPHGGVKWVKENRQQ